MTDCTNISGDPYVRTHLNRTRLHPSVYETVNGMVSDLGFYLCYSFAHADRFTLESDIDQIIKITQTAKQTQLNSTINPKWYLYNPDCTKYKTRSPPSPKKEKPVEGP